MYHHQFDNRAEYLVVVDASLLRETTDHAAGLVPSQGAVRVELVLEQPFAYDNIGTGRAGHKALDAVGDESIVLHHRSAQIRISKGTMIVRQDQRGCHGGEVEAIHCSQAASLGPPHWTRKPVVPHAPTVPGGADANGVGCTMERGHNRSRR